ncbi:hypothetical protein [Cryptosporangium arvum]|uniref:Uncharacterized protein n=1 Tax=Cryptosporangium arvum DSM 44712 TaxID=927661 RepID=A0A011AJP8_9ACTN|nr:hypothetical protein [Cryptosporangium arvum]EXG82216.1 hypothetical protein CryarDRAFT_3374 [Cryptosporangium arvum DSM 44712]
MTTPQISLGMIAVANWVGGITGTEELALLIPTVAWVVVAIALALRLFRREQRQ